MKKLLIISTSIIVAFTIFAVIALNNGSSGETLYLLNWGEYIDQDLLDKFGKEYKCQVVEEVVTSSETMYQKITAGTTAYDVAIPGDYMITKLYDEGYLKAIDVNNPEYANLNNYETMFNDKLTDIRKKEMATTPLDVSMPYFWGAYSMVYSTRHSENKDVVADNGFKALFDKSLYNHSAKIGMYNTARWCVSAYYMSQGQDPNSVISNQSKVVSDIKSVNFDVWGDDALKRKVATGDLDLCFTQLGDFFDAVYLGLEEGMGGTVGLDNLPYNVYVPETTAAFYDGMVIPTTTKNETLANKFINFMLDTENAFQNACAIGYSPALKSVIDEYVNNPDEVYYEDDKCTVTLGQLTSKYPFYLDPLVNCTPETTYMLKPMDSARMTEYETIVNQSKSSVSTDNNLGTVLCIISLVLLIGGSSAYAGYVIYKKKKRPQING